MCVRVRVRVRACVRACVFEQDDQGQQDDDEESSDDDAGGLARAKVLSLSEVFLCFYFFKRCCLYLKFFYLF